MVAYTFNTSTQEAEKVGLCKFKVSLPINQALIEMNPHLKQTNEQKKLH